MPLEVADKAGACFGVERALAMVERTIGQASGPVQTFGPLIHNPEVVASLAARGVRAVEELPEDAGVTLVIRSHGVVPEVLDEARARGLDVVDATCPYVKQAQRAARDHLLAGRQVVVLGEAGHPEVEGILASAPGARAVMEPDDLEGLEPGVPVGLVSQTTQTPERFERIERALRAQGHEVAATHTICAATRQRQQAAVDLATRVDEMVVIGGRNSANTTRLAELCAEHCPTHHVERAEELDPRWFKAGMNIGVSAGASTPKAQIDAVCSTICELLGEGGEGPWQSPS